MLRPEAEAGEIRQDFIEEKYDNVLDDSTSLGTVYMPRQVDVSNGFSDHSESDEYKGFVDEDYTMEDYDTLYDLNIDQGVKEDRSAFNHTQFFSSSVHKQLEIVDVDIDLGSSNDELKSNKGSSDEEGDGSKLDNFPKFNRKTDGRHPKFEIGMLFSSREEIKVAIDTWNVKDATDITYVKNENKRVRVVCKDKECR
ncbi:hypothetical protein LIER_37223 [Lithospermum erythrorhizon]|uniref:Transposase MuDR plant domain-containing protein n=1 Tax=Lithospermum erythrorhizon TaxID=34254 RepID=A0AAV3PH59_LITER